MQLRPFQAEALRQLESPGHLLCVSPTGSGKSRIFQEFIRSKQDSGLRCVLVSPLIALARQHAERLDDLGIRVTIGTGNTPGTRSGVWIMSPETLLGHRRQSELREWRPSFLVVDECHCIWEWGEDFRPAFQLLPRMVSEHQIRRSLWLTATLPLDARTRIRAELPDPVRELGRFSLPASVSLGAHRVPWVRRADVLLQWIASEGGGGIVFVQSREATLRLTRLLTAHGTRALPYHAGLSDEERRATERATSEDSNLVLIATSAFGMGMDHPHLNWVILWQAPSTLLALTQAAGRVGRGARAGKAAVLWDYDDFRLLEWAIRGSDRRRAEIDRVRRFLESARCREQYLAEYFDDHQGIPPCRRCDRCRLYLPTDSVNQRAAIQHEAL